MTGELTGSELQPEPRACTERGPPIWYSGFKSAALAAAAGPAIQRLG